MLLLFNAHHEPVEFSLPAFETDKRWAVVFDTDRPDLKEGDQTLTPPQAITLAGRSFVLLSHAA